MIQGATQRTASAEGAVHSSAADWTEHYGSALQRYIAGAGEAELHTAQKIGRMALTEGARLKDVAKVHHEALETMPADIAGGRSAMLRAAGVFLTESLKPLLADPNAGLSLHALLEHEARRMAHFIHDELGQILFALNIAVADLNRSLEHSCHPEVDVVTRLAWQLEEQIHSLSHELRPVILEDLGLVPALEFLARGVSQRSGIRLEVSARLTRRLPNSAETVLYRTVQEALANIVKHSKATKGEIILEQDEETVTCTVRDDGVGFSLHGPQGGAPGGLGLIGMHQRVKSAGGNLSIRSEPNEGTRIYIGIPIAGQRT